MDPRRADGRPLVVDVGQARCPPAHWGALRKVGGYGAATSMALYLFVKSVWIVVALVSGTQPAAWRTAEWVTLNVVTAGMSACGVVLGLALAQGWGRRLPGFLMVSLGWIGGGFLVPLLPYMLATPLVGRLSEHARGDGARPSDGAIPSWEIALITVGFIGMALGLLLALPIYVRDRWPAAVTGRVGGPGGSRAVARDRRSPATCTALVGTLALTLLWSYWAAGGTSWASTRRTGT